MKATDIMTSSVFTCTADESCSQAAHIMCKEDVGVVPVVDPQGAVVGIITDRDVMKAAYHLERRLDDIPVKEAMTRNVISVRPDDDLGRIEELMQVNQIRRLPVIDDDGLLVGIVAIADLVRTVPASEAGDDLAEYDVAETLSAVSQPHAVSTEDEFGELHVHV